MGLKKRDLTPKGAPPKRSKDPNVAPTIKGADGAKIAIEYMPIDRLVPYAKNAKAHPPKQITQIAASLKEFGFIVPVLVDRDNVLVAGHGRILGAQEAGIKQAPVIRAEHLSDNQIRAFRIADNKLQMNSDWLDDILGEELFALDEDGFDLGLMGFSGNELDKLLASSEEDMERADADAPAIPESPVTTKGDVWLLGNHRVVCGDSTVATDVAKALNGAEPHLMVTDPPYGVEYDPEWRNEAARTSKGMGNRAIGAGAIGKVNNDDNADWSAAYALFPGEVVYVWCAPGPLNCKVHDSLEMSGFTPRMQIVWAKNQLVIGRGHYHAQHENCWYAVRKKQGATAHWQGDRTQSTLWQIDKQRASETGHSTQKPIECMQRPIVNNSKEGDAVYEPFSGSGTTIIAAEMTGRVCHAIELNEAYVDVAVMRWQQFTDKAATLEGDGRTFDEIKASRVKDAA